MGSPRVPSQTQPPSGSSASASARVTAASVRREGVSATPDPISAHHVSEPGASSRAHRRVQPETPVGAAYQHRDQRARQMREARRPSRGGLRQPLGRDAVQRRAGDDHVRPGHLVMPVDHNEVEPPRVHARMLHLHSPRATPAQRRADGSGHAAAADHQVRPGAGSAARRIAERANSAAGTSRHGRRGASARSSGASPAASASPSAWAWSPA